MLERVALIERICDAHGVAPGAAALQFPLGHRQVASVIPGGGSAAEVQCNIDWFRHAIPASLWSDLRNEGVLRPDAPVPDA